MRELQILLVGCLIGYSMVITLAYIDRGIKLARQTKLHRIAYDGFVEQVSEKRRCMRKLNLCESGR